MNWGLLSNFSIALLAIINPIGKIPLWLDASGDQHKDVQNRLALFVVFTAGIILLLFLFFGKNILNFFSIDLASFKIGGGILILQLGMSMLRGKAVNIEKEEFDEETGVMERVKSRFRQVVIPMSVPMIAGPGSITTVIIYGSRSENFIDYAALGGIVLLGMISIYFILISGSNIKKFTGDLPLMVVTRLFGLILIAIAIQLMVEGLGEVFPNWMESDGSTPQSELQDDVRADSAATN